MQKIINFRTIFLLFVVSMLTIFFSVKLYVSYFYLFGFLLPLAFLILLIVKKKYRTLAISVVLLIIFSIYPYFFIKNFSNKNFENQDLTITAKIESINEVNANFSYLTLNNLTFLTNDNQQFDIKGKMSLSFNCENLDDIKIGCKIVFNARVKATNVIFNGQINTLYLTNNIRYTSENVVYQADSTIIQGDMALNEQFKQYNKHLLVENLGKEKGNLAFGVLFGDKKGVNDNLLNVFKTSGVMHIFAVSGLHVGLIVAILYFVLKKFKLNNLTVFFVTAICLTIFSYLCSFNSPVVRASIMAIVALFAKIVKRKNDNLNTLSLSGLILLCINPLNIFDGGFQMTFAAVFGILLFSQVFNGLSIKNVILKKTLSLISVSIATQLTLLPILSHFYGYYATWSILGNLFTLPLFSLFYTLLFVINLLVVIMPFMHFLFFLPNSLLSVIIALNSCVAVLPFGIIKIYSFDLMSSVIYYMFLFSLSKFLLLNIKYKIALILSLTTLASTSIYFVTRPFKSTENGFYFYNNKNNGFSSLLVTSNNSCYMINPEITEYNIKLILQELNNKRINKLSGIMFTENYSFEATLLSPLLSEYNATLYLPYNHQAYNNLIQMGADVVNVESNKRINLYEFDIEYKYSNNVFVGTFIDFGYFNYFEFNSNIENEIYLKDFIITNLNFKMDCVKINNAAENICENYLKANNVLLTVNNNFYYKVA